MRIGNWDVDDAAKRLIGPAGEVELEPRVMDLLVLLARQPGVVVSKSQIMQALWGGLHVNEDALARCVFKLRKALGDDAREPTYIETVSKRGYRLIADVSGTPSGEAMPARTRPRQLATLGAVLLAIVAGAAIWFVNARPAPSETAGPEKDYRLVRADGFYGQFTRTDNEAALQLYENILADSPDDAAALAGLANALTQRQIRYEGPDVPEEGRRSLTEALQAGWLDSGDAAAALTRATALAERATRIDPSHTRAWRALGLALSAQGDFVAAERAYDRALVINPDDWGTMINMSELSTLKGNPERSTDYLEQAWFAMEGSYGEDPVAIRPWHSDVGLTVARAKVQSGADEEAELWYRRVLALDPLNADAVRELAGLLARFGDTGAAGELCDTLARSSDQRC